MPRPQPRLARAHHTPLPRLAPWEGVALPTARVHEVCGRARRVMALRIAAAAAGPVVWISRAHAREPLNPDGMADFCPPGAALFVTAPRDEDLLWALEESLRAGVAPVVVAELSEPPGLTPVRRLHLAAEAGAEAGRTRPLGLILTPGAGGAPGVETRYRIEPVPAGGGWRLERLRARMAPPAAWHLDAGGDIAPAQVEEPA